MNVMRYEEYGIDIQNITHVVGTRLAINPGVILYLPKDKVTMELGACAKSFNADYLPESIKTECSIKFCHKLQFKSYNLKSRTKEMLEKTSDAVCRGFNCIKR